MSPSIDEIKTKMLEVIAEELDVDISSIETEQTFHAMGLDSLSSIFMLNELEEKYNLRLKPMHLWNNPTVDSLSKLVYDMIDENK